MVTKYLPKDKKHPCLQMIVYNVTVSVDNDIQAEWLAWMRQVHIPEVMECGLFTESKMLRVMNSDENGATSFAIQYTCNSMDDYEQYRMQHAPALQQATAIKYGDKVVAFRTLLEVIA